jgi:hypothetical protein
MTRDLGTYSAAAHARLELPIRILILGASRPSLDSGGWPAAVRMVFDCVDVLRSALAAAV